MALCNGKSCGYGFIEFHKGILRYKEKPIENKIAQTVQIPQIVQKQEIKQIIEPQIVAKTKVLY